MDVQVQRKLHVKKGDTVLVLTGKSRGHRGKILEALPGVRRVRVEGANIVKRHQKPRGRRPGGIIQMPALMSVSNVMPICPSCNQPTRPRRTKNAEGRPVRLCRRCAKALEQE